LGFAGTIKFKKLHCNGVNITLQATGEGALDVGVPSNAKNAPIGTTENGNCVALLFVNSFIKTASGTDSAGIGTGKSTNARSSIGSITILDGDIQASSSGSGIGSGTGYVYSTDSTWTSYRDPAISTVTTLTIANGKIAAKSRGTGAGIGCGYTSATTTGNSQSRIGTLRIINGDITAR
jgi:hypothetical protein